MLSLLFREVLCLEKHSLYHKLVLIAILCASLFISFFGIKNKKICFFLISPLICHKTVINIKLYTSGSKSELSFILLKLKEVLFTAFHSNFLLYGTVFLITTTILYVLLNKIHILLFFTILYILYKHEVINFPSSYSDIYFLFKLFAVIILGCILYSFCKYISRIAFSLYFSTFGSLCGILCLDNLSLYKIKLFSCVTEWILSEGDLSISSAIFVLLSITISFINQLSWIIRRSKREQTAFQFL